MNKRVLIISPFFPPTNAADMHRVRTSLPYFTRYGWEPEVVCVAEQDTGMPRDPLLLENVPVPVPVHQIRAVSKSVTAKLGLGSLALRSMWSYRQAVNRLLQAKQFDLIYFSTTQFPLCILGAYWKKRFGIPFVIDMQDPWHSDYYRNKPRAERPKKYWFSYRLNKTLEPVAMQMAGGLVSVSEKYIQALKARYPKIRDIPAVTVPFGAYEPDLATARVHADEFAPILEPGHINLVYIGRGGADMRPAVRTFFNAFKKFKAARPALAQQVRIWFLGTSYAPAGSGVQTIMPLAAEAGLADQVTEHTDRISYFHALATLLKADALFIPGSDDPAYTASKLYPYLLTAKPLLALFHAASPALATLAEFEAPYAFSYEQTMPAGLAIENFLLELTTGGLQSSDYSTIARQKYSCENMTRLQCELFEKVLQC